MGAIPASERPTFRNAPSEGPPPPAPGILETIGAGFGAARADTTGYAQEKREQAYASLIDALADLGHDPAGYVTPSRAGSGMNYARIFADAQRARAANGKLFRDLPATIEQFEERWRERARTAVEADEDVVARGNGIAGFVGGVAGAMTDPVNVMTLPVGGFGKHILTKLGTEALANMAVEAAMQPTAQAQREALGRRDLTLEEAATNVLFAGVGAAALRGGFEIGGKVAPHVRAAVEARLPDGLKQRWAARQAAGEDPFSDAEILADAIEALTPREQMAEGESALVDELRAAGREEAGNPFVRNGAGQAVHDAMMADTFARVMAASPFTGPPRPAPTLPDSGRTGAAGPAAPTRLADTGAEGRFMAKVRGAESGGNDAARNPRSSATGRYQFTDGTWLAYWKRRFGATMSDREILLRRSDGRMQDLLMQDLTDDNAAFLKSRGEAVTEGNLYLTHFAGQGGARRIFDADPDARLETVLGADVVRANPFLRGKTAQWLIRWAHGKMDSAVPRRAGARVEADPAMADALSRNAAEGARIQQALDDAVARADALAEAGRAARQGELTVEQYVDAAVAGRWGESGTPPEAQQFAADNAAAIEAEFATRAEAAPGPLDAPELHQRDADMPDAEPGERNPGVAPEVQALLPELEAVVGDRTRSLNAIEQLADELGADAETVRRGLTVLAQSGKLRFVQRFSDRQRVKNARGRWRTRSPQEIAAESGLWQGGFARQAEGGGPEDLFAAIVRHGGLEPNGLGAAEVARIARDGGTVKGHDLRNTAGLQNMMVPGRGPVLRPSGLGLDGMLERLHDDGFFGPPDVTPRPSEAEFLTLISDLSRTGAKRFSAYDQAPDAARADDGPQADEATEAEWERITAETDAYWARYDQISEAAAQRYKAVLLIDDTLEIEALMRAGTDLLPPLEPAPHLTEDDMAPYIGEWLNGKIDEALDAARLEAEEPWYGPDEGPAGEAGQAGNGGDRSAREPGDAGAGGAPPGAGDGADAGTPVHGADLAAIPAAERSPFLDPDGDAAKAQAESLEHDARMAARGLIPVEVTKEAPRPGVRRGEPGMMLGEGEVVMTATGRETTPVPNVAGGTDRKATNALRRMYEWLIENAKAEAGARGDDFNGPMFERMTAKNITPSDIDLLNEYLFGAEQPPIRAPIFKEIGATKAVTPALVTREMTTDDMFAAIRDMPDDEATEDALAAMRSDLWADADANDPGWKDRAPEDNAVGRFDIARERWEEQHGAARAAADDARKVETNARVERQAQGIIAAIKAGKSAVVPVAMGRAPSLEAEWQLRVRGGQLEYRMNGNKDEWLGLTPQQHDEVARQLGLDDAPPVRENDDGQMDFAAPTREQQRVSLERQMDGRKKGTAGQKPPGSDGGLFDLNLSGVRMDENGEARPIADMLDDLDDEAAALKAARACIIPPKATE